MTRMLMPRFDIVSRPMRSLFDSWFDPYPYVVDSEEWMPDSDLSETEKSYVVTLEVPGIDMKKTDISYHSGVLTIKGEKGKESREDECCHCAERYAGSFQRSFQIPGEVDSDKIDATYKDGVLKLTLPKSEGSMPKKIKIH